MVEHSPKILASEEKATLYLKRMGKCALIWQTTTWQHIKYLREMQMLFQGSRLLTPLPSPTSPKI